jgi:uncharacterized membrane protein YuzA (DUF378 family)
MENLEILKKDTKLSKVIYLVVGIVTGFALMYLFLTYFPQFKRSNSSQPTEVSKY